MHPPVVDYERMKKMYPQVISKEYNYITCICIFFITVGILVLIQRYKEKQFRQY